MTTPLRIWRSPYSNFYKDETLHASKVYTDKAVKEIANAGFTAIWVHGILRDLVPSPVFPEFGKNSAAHLRSLRTVIRRAKKHGLQVLVYMQPPRGIKPNDPFWKKYPEVKGQATDLPHDTVNAMCTSHPLVKEHVRGCAETLSKRLPDLGGLILITASEYMAHCYSRTNYRKVKVADFAARQNTLTCPRCAKRHPSDVVAEVITLVNDGLKAAGNGARVIAWNWSWGLYEADPNRRILKQLPKDVALLVGFERGGKKKILGKTRVIDEYSISYAGPSERFQKTHKAAKEYGLDVLTKLQFATTHELATVPNLPLIGSLYNKVKGMRKLRVTGFMGCWNFGNMLNANTNAFNRFLTLKRLPPQAKALKDFAAEYFPGCDAKGVAEAWGAFEDALGFYPFCIPFLYYSPTNYAPGLPIEAKKLKGNFIGRAWMDDARGDNLDSSFGPYTINEIIKGLGELTLRWEAASKALAIALEGSTAKTVQEEMNSVRASAHFMRSAWNHYRAYKLRKNWSAKKKAALVKIAEDELTHLDDFLALIQKDKRIGFHSECQAYLVTPKDVRKKIKGLKALTGKN
jgi:hypothetical protein